MYILGIDPSQNSCGICLTKNRKLLYLDTCSLFELSQIIEKIKKKYKIESIYLVVETFSSNPRFLVCRSSSNQAIKLIKSIWPRKNKVLKVFPQTWRKYLFGVIPRDKKSRKKDLKHLALDYAIESLGTEDVLEADFNKSCDKSEAFCLAEYGYIKLLDEKTTQV